MPPADIAPQPASPPARQPRPWYIIAGLCSLNWLVPGSGFILAGDRARGWALFGLINGTFALGIVFNGALYIPELRPGEPTFSMVSAITFLAQALHGGGIGLLALAERTGGALSFLVRDPAAAYADLGAFHFIVAGILNYTATMGLVDYLRGSEGGGEKKEKPAAAETESGAAS